MSTTEQLEQQAAAVQARRTTLAAKLNTAEGKVETKRDALGAAVAKGTDTSRIREELRELNEEVEGFRRALPILDREIESLARQATEVQLGNARAAYTEATTRIQRAFGGMEAALRTFAEGPLSEARAELDAATEAHSEAQDALGKLHQATGGAPLKPAYPWEKHQPLRLLLGSLEQFATDGRAGAVPFHSYTAGRVRVAEKETTHSPAFR